MPRARNKDDLVKFSSENYSKLIEMISRMTENQLNTSFDFSDDKSKKEAHWSRDKNVRDVLIHLYEWHCLLLQFIKNNETVNDKKSAIAFLPPGVFLEIVWCNECNVLEKASEYKSYKCSKNVFRKS